MQTVSTPLVANEKLSKIDGSEFVDERLYRQIVGMLLYLRSTRPNIIFVASLLPMFMHCPSYQETLWNCQESVEVQ